MNSYYFIFSTTRYHWVLRHLAFWTLYCIYFWVQSINPMDFNEFFESSPYKFAFINFCAFIPMCIISVYVFIYFLLPRFLQEKKYLLFSIAFFAWFAFTIFINYFASGFFLNNIHYKNYIVPDFENILTFDYKNSVWAITIALLALGIKLTKNWYLQQRENLAIIERKTRIELNTQKAFIQPEFLLRSLDSISSRIDFVSNESANMILQLSDFLSYNLYHEDTKLIPLEIELQVLKDYLELEKKNYNNFLNVDLEIKGNSDGKFIAPVIMLSLVQEMVSRLSYQNIDRHQIVCSIDISQDHIAFRSLPGIHESQLHDSKWKAVTDHTESRLNLFFAPSSYQVTISNINHEVVIMLEMPLDSSDAIDDSRPGNLLNQLYEPA